jgi:ATP synthase protein I
MGERDDGQELRAKLDALKEALERRRAEKSAKEASGASQSERAGTGSAFSLGLRAASEFSVPIVVGALIGWRLDRWMGTKPAFLIALFFLGAAAGVLNVIRAASPKVPLTDRNSSLSHAEAADKDGRRAAPAAGEKAPDGADDDED